MKIRLENIRHAYGIHEGPSFFKKGKDLSVLPALENAWIEVDDGIISGYGKMSELDGQCDQLIDCSNRSVLPTWIDSHTHIVFSASRHMEFRMRIDGKSYEEIAEEGGGILNSANKLRKMDEEELYESAAKRVEELIKNGVGGLEIKSGYGLTSDSELKMLRVIRRLKESFPIPIKSTFLGAHAIPSKYKANRSEYIRILIDTMIPQVTDEGLADYIDVFCEEGFFSVDESREILKAGIERGLRPKIHANELAVSGGVQLACELNALSCDHLEVITDVEIDCLLNHSTIPTLLPGTSFFLNLPYAPARKMIDAGLGVCLASDYNPGSTPSGNISFLLSLACIKMGMKPEEAVNAMTINGACALELENELGTISEGKRANLIITEPIEDLSEMFYY